MSPKPRARFRRVDTPFDVMKLEGETGKGWSPESGSMRKLYDEDVRWLSNSPQGRRVLGRLLFADCSLTESASNPTEAGHREVGVMWLSRLQQLCPDSLPTIWGERLNLLRSSRTED